MWGNKTRRNTALTAWTNNKCVHVVFHFVGKVWTTELSKLTAFAAFSMGSWMWSTIPVVGCIWGCGGWAAQIIVSSLQLENLGAPPLSLLRFIVVHSSEDSLQLRCTWGNKHNLYSPDGSQELCAHPNETQNSLSCQSSDLDQDQHLTCSSLEDIYLSQHHCVQQFSTLTLQPCSGHSLTSWRDIATPWKLNDLAFTFTYLVEWVQQSISLWRVKYNPQASWTFCWRCGYRAEWTAHDHHWPSLKLAHLIKQTEKETKCLGRQKFTRGTWKATSFVR